MPTPLPDYKWDDVRSKYGELFDGFTYEVTPEEYGFDDLESLRASLRSSALHHGYKVRTQKTDRDTLVVKAVRA